MRKEIKQLIKEIYKNKVILIIGPLWILGPYILSILYLYINGELINQTNLFSSFIFIFGICFLNIVTFATINLAIFVYLVFILFIILLIFINKINKTFINN